MRDQYHTIAKDAYGEYKEKGSKFQAYVRSVHNLKECEAFLAEIKELHPKARHHCYAYRLGLDKLKDYRANDDGEPSGSAGKPILGQLDSKGVTNAMAIVVRYFGGTKLGVPGLIHAYKVSTREALDIAGAEERLIMDEVRLRFDFALMNEVMRKVKQHKVKMKAPAYDEKGCTLDISMRQSERERIVEDIERLLGVTADLLD